MSLTIKTPTLRITWRIGDALPILFAMAQENITSISADGEELDHIKINFDNLPMPAFRRIVFWYGDTAKFIVANFWANKSVHDDFLQNSIAKNRNSTNENNET